MQLPMRIVPCISTLEVLYAKEAIVSLKISGFATDIYLGWSESWGKGVSLDRVTSWLRHRSWMMENIGDLDLFGADRIFIESTPKDLAMRCVAEKITHIVAESDDWSEVFDDVSHRFILAGDKAWREIERAILT
jgi:hypothetical protein